jgi:hypothetical protein
MSCDVLFIFIQEHWLSSSQLSQIDHINSNFLCHAVSGFDNSQVLSGRPYCACAILWRSDRVAQVDTITTIYRCLWRLFSVVLPDFATGIRRTWLSLAFVSSTMKRFSETLSITSIICCILFSRKNAVNIIRRDRGHTIFKLLCGRRR